MIVTFLPVDSQDYYYVGIFVFNMLITSQLVTNEFNV